MKFHDENQNLTNFTPLDLTKNDLKIRNENIQKVATFIPSFETNLEIVRDRNPSIQSFVADKIELLDITNKMIEESEEKALKFKNAN